MHVAESNPQTQLQAMRQLAENWDGYGAAPPQSHVIDLAREFVSLVEALLQRREVRPGVVHVSPARTGGVLIEWQDGVMEHEVEIDPDQSLSFLHHNTVTGDIETRKLSPGVHSGLAQGCADATLGYGM